MLSSSDSMDVIFWERRASQITYESPEYSPNSFVSWLSKIIRIFRFTHSNDFADYLSPSKDEQYDYVYGVLFFSIIIIGIGICWGVLLLILKCRGENAGCASGRVLKTTLSNESMQSNEIPVTDTGRTNFTMVTQQNQRTITVGAQQSQRPQYADEPEIFFESGSQVSQSARNNLRNRMKSNAKMLRSVRFTFLLFSLAALVTLSALYVLSLSKLLQSVENSEIAFAKTQYILDQVASSTESIIFSTYDVKIFLNSTDKEISLFCLYEEDEKISSKDIKGFVKKAENELNLVDKMKNEDLRALNQTMEKVQSIKSEIETGMEIFLNNYWIALFMLLILSIIIIFSMFGVILAWREKSGKIFQRVMSYGILPLLIIFCVAGWIGTFFACISTVIGCDLCIPSPDSAIKNILDLHFIDRTKSFYKAVSVYTNACEAEDPVNNFIQLEGNIQTLINFIWQEMTIIDSMGEEVRGCRENLDDFLDATHMLAKKLTVIGRGLENIIENLHCSNINPIYVELVHDTLCGEIVDGVGWTFVLLMILSICLMVMLSFRSGWLHEIQYSCKNEKVYNSHDEEINCMYLDEHEEYLSYISKYKHEWEDYEGIDSSTINGGNISNNKNKDNIEVSVKHYDEGYESFSSQSDENFVNNDNEEFHYESSLAQPSIPDDISFSSLQLSPSIAGMGIPVLVIPTLLPPTYSQEKNDDFHFEAFEVVAPSSGIDEQPSKIPLSVEMNNNLDDTFRMVEPYNGLIQPARHCHFTLTENNDSNDTTHIGLSSLCSRVEMVSSDDVSIIDRVMKSFEDTK